MVEEKIENPSLQFFEVETQIKLKFEFLKKERKNSNFIEF